MIFQLILGLLETSSTLVTSFAIYIFTGREVAWLCTDVGSSFACNVYFYFLSLVTSFQQFIKIQMTKKIPEGTTLFKKLKFKETTILFQLILMFIRIQIFKLKLQNILNCRAGSDTF